jgi:hypothetical protein
MLPELVNHQLLSAISGLAPHLVRPTRRQGRLARSSSGQPRTRNAWRIGVDGGAPVQREANRPFNWR